MSDYGVTLPPFKTIERALRRTTEHLARELRAPTDAAPPWNDFEWATARAAAALQGITTLLANRNRWSGPQQWISFLAGQADHARLRDARIGDLLRRIDHVTRDAGLACTALKGAALRRYALYAVGERPMGDIDLLVRPEDSAAVEVAMRALAYQPAFVTHRHAVFEPRVKPRDNGFGEHVDNPLKIEIHTRIAEPLPARMVDITSRILPASMLPGLNDSPDAGSVMCHLLLHAAGNMRAHTLRLVQLHDIAQLAARVSATEWEALLATPDEHGGAWWMWPPLALTARYYPSSIAASVLAQFHKRCPPLLRRSAARVSLTDVSWSNLRIHAFPGITWARSPAEALSFAHSRIFPTRIALAELRLAETAQPALTQVPWYGVSHLRRICRWIATRPPRVQTLLSVRGALFTTTRP